jgi:glycogen debranching enzyme
MPVVTPDLPAYLALQADHLALMASVLGLEEEAEAWRSEARSITQRLVARHWRVRQGSFVSFFRNRPVLADTVIGLLPIVTGRLPLDVARQLVATIEDPERFWSTFPVPSVALSDPEFDPTHMWRGPTWLFTDYLLVDGLRRSGFGDAAERLRERTVRMVEQDAGTPEFFHPVLGRRPDMATATFSGTAALYLELVLGARV